MVRMSPEPRTLAERTERKNTDMSNIGRRVTGVAVGALLLVGLGGAGFAYAQTTDGNSPTTTNPPASAPAANDPAHCQHGRGGGGGGGGASGSSGSTSQTPSSSSADPGSL
jgi:hypothetical protein